MAEAERYIQAFEFTTQEGKTDSRQPDRNSGSKPEPSAPKPEEKKRKEIWTVDGEPPKKKKKVMSYESKYEFNSDCYSILMDIKDRLQFEKPPPMKGPTRFRDKSKYCHFHKDIGHETNDCISLKKLLDKLAADGHLNSYVLKSTVTLKTDKRTGKKADQPASSEETDPGVVSVIAGGFASGGPTIRGAKNHARSLHQVMTSGKVSMPPFPEVTIAEKDRGKIQAPHEDPMVVEFKVANLRVRRILIDTRSSSDIISWSCLNNLKSDEKNLEPVSHPLVGFGGGVIHPVGRIDLPVRIGEKTKCRNLVIRFLVVKDLKAYNIIIGQPTLNVVKAVIVPSLMLMKFECGDGAIGSIYGDQQMARDCYLTTVKSTTTDGERSTDDKQETSKAGQKRKAPEEKIKVKQEKQ